MTTTAPPPQADVLPDTLVETIDGSRVEIVEPPFEPYSHAPGDKVRVAIASGVFLATLLAAGVFQKLIGGAADQVKELTSRVPTGLATFLVSIEFVIVVISVAGLAATLVWLRRVRVALMVGLAMGSSYLIMDVLSHLLSNAVPLPADLGEIRFISAGGPHFLAMGAAVVTVLGPWFSRAVRRVGVGTVAFVAFTRVANLNTPYDVAMSLMLGWLVGAIVVMLFGSPNRHPIGTSVAEALLRAGVKVRRLELIGAGSSGSSVYLSEVEGADRQFVKVFSDDRRDADLLLQVVRWVRLREASDENSFSSLRRAVEHEALLTLKATSDGIPAARLLAVAEIDPSGMLLAFEHFDDEPLEGRGSSITDEQLERVWRLVESLRANHIAHRELNLAHILVDPDGQPRVVDLGFAELAARPSELRSDLAELLCAVAIEVGAERAVDSAAAVLGPEVLGDMVSRLQPLALTSHTRGRLKQYDGLLDELRQRVQTAASLEEVHYEELARLRPRTIAVIVVLAVALYALLPQLPAVSDIGTQVSQANWIWVIPMLLCMVGSWFGATLSVIGAVPDRLPFWTMFRAQVSASFLDTLAPAGLGGLAYNTRIMQKRGVEPAVAVAGMGLNGVAGFVVHVVLLGVFLLWANASGGAATETGTEIAPPEGRTLLIGLVVVAVFVGLAFVLPFTRKYIRTKGIPMVKDAFRGLAELARRPRKLVALFGGSTLVTVSFLGALICAVEAFGGDVGIPQLSAAYMIAFAVAIFAPTPGSLGALELGLIAAFQQLGMNADTAVSSVLLFRVGTFWLPVIPGWLFFHWSQRRGEV